MKIAMIGHKTVPSRDGGVEIVVEELSSRMAEKGHTLTLFNRKRKGVQKYSEYKGCALKEIFTVNKKSLDALIYAYFATKKAKKMAKKGQFDVIHYHAEGPCAFLNKFPKKEKRDYKIVATVHGLDWQRGKWGGFATKFLKRCEEKMVKYADAIIVLSENNKKYFLENYGRETVFIPNGINKPELVSADLIKNQYGLDKDDYILFLARIVPEKGLHYLIDAWKEVVKVTGTDKKLVIAGGNSHSTEYFNEVMASANGDDTIIATGFVQGQKLAELFSNAYLYVLPSDIEGMPVSLLEALSYGNACLVSDIPENTEVIRDNGYTFKKGNVKDLADKLVELINKNLITHDKQIIPYTWEEITEKTLDAYRK